MATKRPTFSLFMYVFNLSVLVILHIFCFVIQAFSEPSQPYKATWTVLIAILNVYLAIKHAWLFGIVGNSIRYASTGPYSLFLGIVPSVFLLAMPYVFESRGIVGVITTILLYIGAPLLGVALIKLIIDYLHKRHFG